MRIRTKLAGGYSGSAGQRVELNGQRTMEKIMEAKRPGIIRRFFAATMKFITALRQLVFNLFFLLILGLLGLALSESQLPVMPEKGALVLNLKGQLVDQLSYVDPLVRLLGESNPEQQETLLQDVIDAIDYAKDDGRINTLVLSLDGLAYGGISKMQEIASALEAFRSTGKKIIATGDNFSQDQYWLAAQADEIYLHPMGAVMLEGYGLYRSYYKEALDKLQINFHVFRVGQFKSAMEPFLRNDMSEQAREANLFWLNGLWNEYVQAVAARRKLSPANINDYINNIDQLLATYKGNTASAAVASGLVDGVKTRDEANDYISEVVGAADEEGYFQGIGFEKYLWLKSLELSEPRHDEKVGVIVAAGTIVDGIQPPGGIGGDTLAELIRQARQDATVRALVLRIDSGGGSAFASEIIRRELELYKQEGKPLVVSMGSMAASGGYWIAANADEIWATPTTLTGSIGIYGAFPTIEQTLGELGISTDGVGTTKLAGALRLDRPLAPILQRSIQSQLEHGYYRFIEIVADGREMPKEQIEHIAQGRVWAGAEALSLGLVDKLGGLSQAIDSAAALAQLDQYDWELIELPISPQEQFLRELSNSAWVAQWLYSGAYDAGAGNNLRGQLQWLLDPITDGLAFLKGMNDPRGLYLHCPACVAP